LTDHVAPRGDKTRERLIAATDAVVRRVGYAHATTRAIAEEAGVAEGTIYRHFPHKATLFFAVVMARNEPVAAWLDELPGRAGTATVRGNLEEALARFIELRNDVLPLEIALRADPGLAEAHTQALLNMGGSPPDPLAPLAGYLKAEQRLGRVRSDADPRAVALVLLASILGFGMLPPAPRAPRAATLVRHLLDVTMPGLEPGCAGAAATASRRPG